MTVYLVGARSVHVAAAACDYLQGEAGPDDEVVVCTATDDAAGRDAGDAANVASVRLVDPTVTADERRGDPASALREAAAAHGADVLVLGAHGGDSDASGLGSTTRAVLADADRPVVVVPVAVG